MRKSTCTAVSDECIFGEWESEVVSRVVLKESVTVVGYPLGGDTISVTKGVVSRVEVTSYAHGSSELLGIQIDAAINPGNSGGPAFNGKGECIGVAFQVPYHANEGQPPSYLIIAGLVFTPLSEALIEEEREDCIGLKLLAKARYSFDRFKGEQIVILSQVLANELNIGYEDMNNQQVIKFNGVRIKNIHHLAHLIDSCKDKYLCFEFEDSYAAVLEREAVIAASSSLLRDYGIQSERSSDLDALLLEDRLE